MRRDHRRRTGVLGRFRQRRRLTSCGNGFAAADIGSHHACALKLDHTAVCWGDSTDGRTTPPTDANSDPVAFSAIAVGWNYACGVETDDSLACWGTAGASNVTSPPAGQFASVTLGRDHACGLKTDSTVLCWGSSADERTTPPTGAGNAALEFSMIDAGDDHTCGVLDDGSLVCWGEASLQRHIPSGEFTLVATGDAHACAARTGGGVFCWGDDSEGQFQTPAALVRDDCAAADTTVCEATIADSTPGTIETDTDTDWFAVDLEPGVAYRLYARAGSGADVQFAGVYDSTGTLVDGTDDTHSGTGSGQLPAVRARRDRGGPLLRCGVVAERRDGPIPAVGIAHADRRGHTGDCRIRPAHPRGHSRQRRRGGRG